jgi:hypothetical protein
MMMLARRLHETVAIHYNTLETNMKRCIAASRCIEPRTLALSSSTTDIATVVTIAIAQNRYSIAFPDNTFPGGERRTPA